MKLVKELGRVAMSKAIQAAIDAQSSVASTKSSLKIAPYIHFSMVH